MVKENGYGLQVDVLQRLLKYGVRYIVITTKAGTKHVAKFTDWIKNGNKKDYGNGEQVFLNIKFTKQEKSR